MNKEADNQTNDFRDFCIGRGMHEACMRDPFPVDGEIKLCKDILKPDGSIWISGTPHNTYQVGHALQSLGFHILNEIIWYKPNAPPNLACRCFAHAHETILWAKKSKLHF